MMKKSLLILLFFALISQNIFAAKLYQVNVIIFSHITSDALSSETWPNKLMFPNTRGAIDLLDQQTIGNYQLRSDDQFGLKNELDTLSKRSDYHVLLTMSWTQPMTSARASKWIHIYGGQPYDQTGQPIQNYGLDQAATTTLTPQISTDKPNYWEINGKMKVSFQNFYQIYARLYLTEPESIFDGSTDSNAIGNFQPIPLTTFYLHENRNTRLNEVNYLDHPLFGILIKIIPSRE